MEMPGAFAPLISAARNMLYGCRMSAPVIISRRPMVDIGTMALSFERM